MSIYILLYTYGISVNTTLCQTEFIVMWLLPVKLDVFMNNDGNVRRMMRGFLVTRNWDCKHNLEISRRCI